MYKIGIELFLRLSTIFCNLILVNPFESSIFDKTNNEQTARNISDHF
jgi:hypothetical protein